MVFLRGEDDRLLVDRAATPRGSRSQAGATSPRDLDALGPQARETAPLIEQAILVPPVGADDELERPRVPCRASGSSSSAGPYVASLSFRTVTYKALCAADHLAEFYLDLADPHFDARFGIFHQRFSTNTEPSWERAQPFRLLCHNGEINAIEGNVNWMRAREGRLGSGRRRRCSGRSSTRPGRTPRCSTTRSSSSSAMVATSATR
jgi:glutamate synthase (ferredoxin)